MNGLSVQLGYKGISKTFSACVEEMIKDGYIERNISRGQHSKIKRFK